MFLESCPDDLVPVVASYDIGWAKRGRAMKSTCGVDAMAGLHSGKVLAFESRKKRSGTCQVEKRNGRMPQKHDCRCKWMKSSKAMEPDVASSLAKQLPETGIQLGSIIADDDAATIKRIREVVDSSIGKWADLCHTKKNFGLKLEEAKHMHKELKSAKVT